ncbi:flagellar basal body-associated protein FliL [Alsobacter soli]|uniref:Flagellar protein FliL n=1 Tax=Alsobacter soli TaxID=2109933 RepID=A0A2T1HUB0_9HYPH|nr:flagellar basal body-associated FliL family protein [Alsobacter soli]PSC05234.1 flagellar basal body-associated protein FliL [Alsobacter soli]
MAKKPKKGAPEEVAEAKAPAEASEIAVGGGKKKLIIIAAAALLVLGGGGGGGFYWWKKKQAEHAAEAGDGHGDHGAAAAPKKTAFVDMKEMMVNLGGQNTQQTGERPRYLKMKIALEVADPKLVTEVTPLLPRIEDTFQVYTRELRPSDLEGSAGVYRLKEELLRRINIAIYPSKVDAILFKEILIQ